MHRSTESLRILIFLSFPGMILALDVSFELCPVEIHVAQAACRIARGLIAEMLGFRIAALAAGGYGLRADLRTELHGGNETVSGCSIPLLSARIRACAEGGE